MAENVSLVSKRVLRLKQPPISDYETIWHKMRLFTEKRTDKTNDEIWFLEHYPVFTQGHNGKSEHLLSNPQNIPLIKSNRGGQITYHGPGQLIVYFLIDLRRKSYGIKKFIHLLENSIIELLDQYHISANTIPHAPGVYVNKQKIGSLGLKVSHGCTYHGIALNVNMDLTPFSWINPCGFPDLKMTQMRNFVASVTVKEVSYDYAKITQTKLDSQSISL